MSKKIYLFSLVLLALTFTACSETEEAGRYDNWRARSEAFIDSIASVYDSPENQALAKNDPEKLHRYKDEVTGQWIYVKKISKTGDSQAKPFSTSSVEAVQQNFVGTEPDEFDSPTPFSLDEVISGWTYTLPYMTEGEFWTLYVPYQSGYDSGTGSDGSLQPYSALVYNVKLDKIVDL